MKTPFAVTVVWAGPRASSLPAASLSARTVTAAFSANSCRVEPRSLTTLALLHPASHIRWKGKNRENLPPVAGVGPRGRRKT